MGLLGYDIKVSANASLGETVDFEAAHSEWNCLTHSFIDYVILCLLEDEVKVAANAAPGGSLDVEAVLGVDIKDKKVETAFYGVV